MRKIFALLVCVLVLLFSIVLLSYKRKADILKKYSFEQIQNQAVLKPVKIGNTVINVEIADTPVKTEKGLSGRISMDKDKGMLFVFQNKNYTPTFWMIDMNFPLDFVWIKNSKVFQITENVPNPLKGSPPSQLPLYRPNGPVDFVLEVNAGFCNENNIKVGDSVDLTSIN